MFRTFFGGGFGISWKPTLPYSYHGAESEVHVTFEYAVEGNKKVKATKLMVPHQYLGRDFGGSRCSSFLLWPRS
jgi:hypothetical protein